LARPSIVAGILTCCVITLGCPVAARAGEAAAADAEGGPAAGQDLQVLPVVTVQATAIPGAELDADKVPGNVQSLSATDLSRTGQANLTGTLSTRLGSINIDANLDDPFQPDILYRGFEASPVLGTPQGLAVYQNGVRINEAFGDTVNWDLIPDIAIQRVTLVGSNPVYGLNAIGGAVSVTMKNGFDYHGADAELSGGSFGRRAAAVQYGASSQHLGIYVAGNALNSDGWRLFSSDQVRTLYGVLSARTDHTSVDLSYTGAHNNLDGEGAAPVQELAVNRSLVFTGPQANLNRLDFLTLNASLQASDTLSAQALLYYRHYAQRVANGDTSDYGSCSSAALAGSLCQDDGLTPVNDAAGQALPDISDGGDVVIGQNDFEAIHAYGRGAGLQVIETHPLGGHGNHFAAGATLDYARVNFLSGTQVGVMSPQLVVLPSDLLVDTPEGSEFSATPVNLQSLNRYYGLYLTDTFDVTRALSLTASGRYNLAYIDLQDLRGSELTGNNRYAHFNPAIGATFALRPTLTAYAGMSQDTRTPTASEIECSDPLRPCLLPSNLAGDPPNLRQVVGHTVELGVRGHVPATPTAAGALSWNLGLFRTNVDDDIYGIATSVSSGFYQNIGATRRQGIEAGLNYRSSQWTAYLNYSYIDATFESALTLPSPSNPFRDDDGNISVKAGDRLPGIPQHRLKAGADLTLLPRWTAGASLVYVSDQHYFGDESNQNAPLPGYLVAGLHSAYQLSRHVRLFASIDNLFNSHYATYGIYSDPTGIGAPGVPADGVSNGPGVDNRFQSPAAPFAVYGGVRINL
jgi:iron complex outermembrane receptor protein